ncbi:MAG: phage holin family protein [Gemmataceae bacterium]|nr:phage holin family protein [Gemmataceae bacterium]
MTGPDTALTGRPTEPATTGSPAAGTVTGLVGGIINDAQTLARQQLEMFKAEVREDMARTRQALIFGGLGVAFLTVGGLALVFGLVYLLRDYAHLSEHAAWLIFAAICLAVGVVLGFVARNLFESFNPLPDKTFNALQENLTWKTQPQA